MAKAKLLKDGSVPEKDIQKAILSWLKETGLLHWRQNSGSVFVGNRRVVLGEDGLPDIIVVVPPTGKVLGLEVKSLRGKLRPVQAEFMASLREAGGTYVVVRNLQSAMEAVAGALGTEREVARC